MQSATDDSIPGALAFPDLERHVHAITNAQCSLYTNWAGPIKVPHVAKFAQRTADRLGVTK